MSNCVNCDCKLKSTYLHVQWVHKNDPKQTISEVYCSKNCFNKNPYKRMRLRQYNILKSEFIDENKTKESKCSLCAIGEIICDSCNAKNIYSSLSNSSVQLQ